MTVNSSLLFYIKEITGKLEEICGRPIQISQRIEVTTDPNDNPSGTWPWLGTLGYYSKSTGNWVHNCGASLITKKHAITAAHCHPNLNL